MTRFVCKNKEDQLCDTCFFQYPVCGDQDNSIDFGTGLGYDNIVECDGYEPAGDMPEGIEVIND